MEVVIALHAPQIRQGLSDEGPGVMYSNSHTICTHVIQYGSGVRLVRATVDSNCVVLPGVGDLPHLQMQLQFPTNCTRV